MKTSLIIDEEEIKKNFCGFQKQCSGKSCAYNFKHLVCMILLIFSVISPAFVYAYEIFIVLGNYSTTYKNLILFAGYIVTVSLYSFLSAIFVVEIKKYWPIVLLFILHNIIQLLLVIKVNIL